MSDRLVHCTFKGIITPPVTCELREPAAMVKCLSGISPGRALFAYSCIHLTTLISVHI